ncbi:hypothetical protein LZ31DRAFT_614161, partial [Colletotrichum somersetense]
IAAIRTTNGRRTCRPPSLQVSQVHNRSYCGLPCPSPKLSPMRLDSLLQSADTGDPRDAPGGALRATTATSLGWAWAKTMPGSQEEMAFCLSMERAGGAEAPCGADEPNCKELAHASPVISWGAPQPASLFQASGAHPYRGIGDPNASKKRFFAPS